MSTTHPAIRKSFPNKENNATSEYRVVPQPRLLAAGRPSDVFEEGEFRDTF